MTVIDIDNMADAGVTLNPRSGIGTGDSITTKQLSCHLLELPPELRTAIFLYMLTYRNRILVSTELIHKETGRYAEKRISRSVSVEGVHSNLHIDTNILATCKQIQAEGTPLLYGNNTFCFNNHRLRASASLVWDFFGAVFTSAVNLRKISLVGGTNQKVSAATLRAVKDTGALLSEISLSSKYRAQFTPEKMALALRPLMRALDKRHRADSQKKPIDVVDVLSFPALKGLWMRSAAARALYDAAEILAAKDYDKKVKDILPIMLKGT